MKLYDNVRRIHNELAALGISPDAALRVDQLTPLPIKLELGPGQKLVPCAEAHNHLTPLHLDHITGDLRELTEDLTNKSLKGGDWRLCRHREWRQKEHGKAKSPRAVPTSFASRQK